MLKSSNLEEKLFFNDSINPDSNLLARFPQCGEVEHLARTKISREE